MGPAGEWQSTEASRERGEKTGFQLRAILSRGLAREEDTLFQVFDLAWFENRLQQLVAAFPGNTLHALAMKANPLVRILERALKVHPAIGAEAASTGEIALALKAGFPPGRIVFDSPVKTPADIRYATGLGIHLNIDNLSELGRVATLTGWGDPVGVGGPRRGGGTLSGSFGLRINPQVGTGTIEESSVAGTWSKFGIPIGHRRNELEKAFLSFPWLTGVHLHVGSQGCHPDMLTRGVGILYDFVEEVNLKRERNGMAPVAIFDIGGGLPISYRSDVSPPLLTDYAEALRKQAPGLFDTTRFRLITEFGRWVFTHAGWTVSRVEYVKRDPEVNTAMIHAGADLFLRECLSPAHWQHEYSVYDRQGDLKKGTDDLPYHLAGPLCFSGDILARNVVLPRIEEGDYLVIHDTGGYTFSMWSRYNSRQTPRILGWTGNDACMLKERETPEELTRFWQ